MARSLLGVVSILFVSSVVQAGAIVQTGSVATGDTDLLNQVISPSFQKFDSSLGVLTSVVIHFEGDAQTTLSVKNNSGSTDQTFQATAKVEFQLTNGGVLTGPLTITASQAFGPDTVAASGAKDYGTTNFDGDQTATFTAAGDLANFIGTGNLSDFVVNTLTSLDTTGSGGNLGINQLTRAGAKMTLTYNYQAVPEPSSVVMLGLAGGVVGLASRLRKRRA